MHRIKPLFAVVILAIGLTGCASSPSGEDYGEYLHGAAITTKIKTAFIGDPKVSALNIHVKTVKGTVQLSGEALDQSEIDRAVELAKSVDGVTGVETDIRLKAQQETPSQ